ncbi:hypothetical protein D3C84_852420 [compost metagenome]
MVAIQSVEHVVIAATAIIARPVDGASRPTGSYRQVTELRKESLVLSQGWQAKTLPQVSAIVVSVRPCHRDVGLSIVFNCAVIWDPRGIHLALQRRTGPFGTKTVDQYAYNTASTISWQGVIHG